VNARICALLLVIILAVTGAVRAQDGDEADSLTLFGYDAARPVLFQPLAPDEAPQTANFMTRLEVAPDEMDETIVYVAVENTGWSEGAVGLISPRLSPDETYVALEVWERVGAITLRDDGSGLAFPVEYVEDLDGDDAPGFRFDALIAQMVMFRIYRVTDENGALVLARTPTRDGVLVDLERVSYTIDPEPVFGDLILDFHIIALPEPVPTPEATVTPEVTPVAPGEGGENPPPEPTQPPPPDEDAG
jgi:hypothetical protein